MADMNVHPGGEAALDRDGHGHGEAEHPSHIGQYLKIAVILVVITAIEVAIFYIPALKPVLVPVLLTLSAVKFFIVVLFYMHLKVDSRVFWRVFFGPLFLAVLVVVGMVLIFKWLPTLTP